MAPAISEGDLPLTIALPKGRIQKEALPLIRAAGIELEPEFSDPKTRKLKFATNIPHISVIIVRSFDVATFVAFGAAQLGIAGNDVLMEFDYPDLYAPLDLGIGACRISLACVDEGRDVDADLAHASHVRVATKYPVSTRRYFEKLGIQAECIKLNGAMELAPSLGLAPYIVDLVSTGSTLKANGLKEVRVMTEVTSRLVVNRTAFKTRSEEMTGWIDKLTEAVNGRVAA